MFWILATVGYVGVMFASMRSLASLPIPDRTEFDRAVHFRHSLIVVDAAKSTDGTKSTDGAKDDIIPPRSAPVIARTIPAIGA